MKRTRKEKKPRKPRKAVGVRFSEEALVAIGRISDRTHEVPTAVIRRLVEEQLFGKESAA